MLCSRVAWQLATQPPNDNCSLVTFLLNKCSSVSVSTVALADDFAGRAAPTLRHIGNDAALAVVHVGRQHLLHGAAAHHWVVLGAHTTRD